MSSEIFYELYRKLAGARSEPTKCLAVVDELAKVCRDSRKAATSADEFLADADNCLHEIAESSILFATAVSRWLTVDEDVELAKTLVHKASVRHLQQPTAESYDLSNIEEARAILAACRLCTLSAVPAVSLGWTLSLAISHPTSDQTCQTVDHLLQYHVDEFPWSTRQLLSSEDSPFKSLKKANEALAALEEQEAWLDGLPRLREFAMTPEMRLTVSSLKRSEHRAIHRRSEETSVFAKLFTTQHFKYANKTAVEFVVGDKVQETTLEMSPYSVSVELPLSERTDPGSGVSRRRSLWRGVPQ
ncbi:hypothetical protein [Thiobacillus sp.]|uniref:hypothetical protein n=1 Tax=Thiobacillus sp. TaxID=924 RepID=UPI00286DF17E|nr:hypothetical protein [Thiobacillus sp.]